MRKKELSKAETILKAIRESEVGQIIVIHNENGSIWRMIKIICEEEKELSK